VAIIATAGGASATIKPNRPSLADMQLHYPSKIITRNFLYNGKIRGEFEGRDEIEYLKNTCSVRMSYALLRSGFALRRTADKEGSMLGADGRWYWIRVNDLRNELVERFKGFDAELKFDAIPKAASEWHPTFLEVCAARKAKAQQFINTHLAGKSGIIVFKVAGWIGSTGHFTMWDGRKKELSCAPGHDDPSTMNYYFWFTSMGDYGLPPIKHVTHIQFWELK
jgi:hypothetical protein